MKKKVLSLMLATAMLVTMLAGCGSKDASNDTPGQGTTGTAQVEGDGVMKTADDGKVNEARKRDGDRRDHTAVEVPISLGLGKQAVGDDVQHMCRHEQRRADDKIIGEDLGDIAESCHEHIAAGGDDHAGGAEVRICFAAEEGEDDRDEGDQPCQDKGPGQTEAGKVFVHGKAPLML